MAMTNRDRVRQGLDLLKEGLIPFVERELRARLNKGWIDDVSTRLRIPTTPDGKVQWDVQGLLKAMVDNWQGVFRYVLGSVERNYAGELIDHRNAWAHEKPLTSDDVYRALDTAQRLLQAISAHTQAEAIGKAKADLQRDVFREQARNQTRYQLTLEGMPQAGLKPWREIVTPHPDVASGQYMQAEFAADLAQVLGNKASEEYGDPEEFFRRTYVTAGMRDLLVDALLRMDRSMGDPVVELQTNFGGGKTHSLLALYHLFSGIESSRLEGLEPVLKEADVTNAPKAHRAVLVGTALSPGEVLVKDDGTMVRTLWGEMAWQLGGRKAFDMVAELDEKGVSPGSNLLAELFDRFAPCLVLIDEWVAYARQIVGKDNLPCGNFDAQATFAQAITEAAKAAPRTLVVASIPASRIEIGGDNGAHALDVLKNVFERVGKPWRPAMAEEGFEIVRRRLFEPLTGKEKHAARDAVVNAFARMYRENAGEFPSGCGEGTYRDELRDAYPIHPELFRKLYDEWSTLDKFQRTRGVLRLLAKVIHHLWETQDAGLLIMPASIPVGDPSVKSELTRHLSDVWEPIISQDVDGPNSLPLQIDRETQNLGRFSACRRVARTLYLGTAPSATSKTPGIGDQHVRLGSVQPGEPTGVLGDALRRLGGRARYIHQDGNRYWYSTHPNVNRTADDRTAALLNEPEELYAEIVRRIRLEKARSDFAAVHPCPETTAEVGDDPVARLVVLSPKQSHRRGQTGTAALKAVREFLDRRGNSPRSYRNMLVFLAPDVRELESLLEAVAGYLAWKSIFEQEEKLNLEAFQRNQAKTRTAELNGTVDIRIASTWAHVLVPLQTEPSSEVTWEELKIATGDSLAERAATKVLKEEMLRVKLGGGRLRMCLDLMTDWQNGNHLPFGELAEAFPRYLYLPRLTRRNVLEEAVRDGASRAVIDDTFATAEGYDEAAGRYLGLGVGSVPAVVDNSTLLVKAEAAYRQREAEKVQAAAVLVPAPGGNGQGHGPTTVVDLNKPGGVEKVVVNLPPISPPLPTTFIATARLDPLRIGRDAGRIAEEVLQHLSTLPGARVDVTLEIQVHVPNGVTEDITRAVTENANTLGFKHASFERG